MKTKTYIIAILLAGGLASSRAQDTWTQKADFGGGTRGYAFGFSIDSKGYIGSGNNFNSHDDFWEYDPSANVWTQKANFGGGIAGGYGFSIDSKGYVVAGGNNEFWEYDPATNIWTQKADFTGVARIWAVAFSIGTKGYFGTGTTGPPYLGLDDFWEYDPATNTWAQKANFGGTARQNATGFAIGSKGYIGTGNDGIGIKKDFWEYDPVTNSWTQKTDFGGEARQYATGLSINTKGYIGTGNGSGGSFLRDFWEYDPTTNTWTQKADFGGTGRYYATGFAIGSKGYLGTGYTSSGFVNDFWEYTPGDSGGSGPCIAPPAGLVSWWSGDKTADDVQGTNPGQLLGGVSFKHGMVGPGFLLDGIDDGVTIRNSASLSPTRITVAAWVYITGNQNFFRHIISKDNAPTGMREWGLSVDLETFVPFVGLDTGFFVVGGATVAQLNTWYHVVMTHDGATLRLYVNGALDGSVAAVGDIVATSNPVEIGLNTAVSPFKGIIDEVQIFDRALTDAEILAIYQAGADGQCKPEIFVSSIDPSYTVTHSQYLVSTSIAIQDTNGIGTSNATTIVRTLFPNGTELVFPARTDELGNASFSFYTTETGLYRFRVKTVTHPTRDYAPSLNIETSDTLVIP